LPSFAKLLLERAKEGLLAQGGLQAEPRHLGRQRRPWITPPRWKRPSASWLTLAGFFGSDR